jgi:hypothetical protein
MFRIKLALLFAAVVVRYGFACLDEGEACAVKDSDGEDAQLEVSLLQKDMYMKAAISAEQAVDDRATVPVLKWPYYQANKYCDGVQALTTSHMTYSDYDAVVSTVIKLYDSLPSVCNATVCPQADFAGCMLRLTAHDWMDGIADGCLDFTDDEHKGLMCTKSFKSAYGDSNASLFDAYSDWCTKISLADFMVIAAEAVIKRTRKMAVEDDTYQLADRLRSTFQYGRSTVKECPENAKMAHAEEGCAAVERIFIKRLGLNWQLGAALLGAHTIGGAHPSASGYTGRWVTALESRKFNNNYFVSMLTKGWGPEKVTHLQTTLHQWARTDIGAQEEIFGKEMMLDSDLCLYFTPLDLNTTVPLHASTAAQLQCECAWTPTSRVPDLAGLGEFCGIKPEEQFSLGIGNTGPESDFAVNALASAECHGLLPGEIPASGIPCRDGLTVNFTKQRLACCSFKPDVMTEKIDTTIYSDCGFPALQVGPAMDVVEAFAKDEALWLTKFREAWGIVTTKDHASLQQLTF